MKRSEVNALIEKAKALLHAHHVSLPPFGYWTPREWSAKGHECDEIRDCRLGWDVTDFGLGTFREKGLVLFTLRNGHYTLAPYRNKTYCEKLIIVEENQVCPMHYHVSKQEDIISRCGGNCVIELHNRAPDDSLADTEIEVSMDGVRRRLPAGARVVLRPGESITLPPFLYHAFWAEPGSGTAVLGEVSMVNDDETDNRFLEPIGRFPKIEEDCEPNHYLCFEYPKAP